LVELVLPAAWASFGRLVEGRDAATGRPRLVMLKPDEVVEATGAPGCAP
jgi:hypothetical protein